MASVFVLLEAFNRKEAAALGFFPCATASYICQNFVENLGSIFFLHVNIEQVSFYVIRKKTQIRKQKVPPAKRQTVQRTYTRFFFTILQRIFGIASRLLISRKLLPNSSWILGFESPIPAPITITPSCCNFLMTSRTVSP